MYDLIVIGAGHAGCEAALAAARMGVETLLLTLDLGSVALMPCNPAIGGTGKGHLVREVDALGGQMGLCIDRTFLQSRMLNRAKGPAVHSLRAQADKRRYHEDMLGVVFSTPHLTVRQAEVMDILTKGGRVSGVRTMTGDVIPCRACVVCGGVYLKSRIIIGQYSKNSGPQGLLRSEGLSGSLENLGFALRRFKTGTPARVDVRSIDFDRMEPQPGDDPIVPFSFLTAAGDPDTGVSFPLRNRALCYLTYTNEETHRITRENLHLFALVDTLKYLHKGGRLPTAAAIAGGLLGIKPVIGLQNEKLGMADKARGLPGAYVAIFKQIDKVGGIDEEWPVCVGYTGKKQGVEPFMRYVTNNLHLQKPLLFPIGPVIGTHAGPGACGIAFFAHPEQ